MMEKQLAESFLTFRRHLILLIMTFFLSSQNTMEIPLKLFKTYLTERTQHTAINNNISETLPTNIAVTQGSELGPLLFLIYINNLHNVITYSDMHHFADDTNLLCASKSIKDKNRKVNFDLKNIIHWLRTNKVCRQD